MYKIDLTGNQYGRLTAIEKVGTDKHQAVWRCKCSCGNEKITKSTNLVQGKTKSCGCLVLDTNRAIRSGKKNPSTTTHGETTQKKRSPEYVCWLSMRQRCNDPNHRNYKNYGGKGIQVCESWNQSFESFLKDMGRKQVKGQSIDRVNSLENYTPENCRWATHLQQQNNKTNNNIVFVNGVPLSAIEASRLLNIPYSTLRYRITKFKQGLIPESKITLRR